MHISTTVKRAAVVAAATVALACGVSGSAHADTYDGQDPISSGCANDGYTAASANLYADGIGQVGTVELRYSPSCRTTWARVWSKGGNLYAGVRRMQNTVLEGCDRAGWSGSAGMYYCYTPMVNDAGYTSYALGNATDSSGTVGSHAGYTTTF